jgi:hypothetical protein
MIDGQPDDVMNDVFDSGRDRGGDLVPPEDQGRPRDEQGRFAPTQEAAPEPTPETLEPIPEVEQPEPLNGELIPRGAVIAERKKLQARIAQIEQEAQQREQLYQQQLRQLQQPQQPQELPDIFEDPDAAINARLTPIQQVMESNRLDFSEDRARDKFGDDTVNQAFQAAQRAGIVGQFIQTRHPYGELVKWYQREQTLSEVGTDPKAYRDKLANEIRAEVLKELKAGTAQGQQTQRFPTSLADQTNSGGQRGALLTDDAIMNDVFHTDRNRRA